MFFFYILIKTQTQITQLLAITKRQQVTNDCVVKLAALLIKKKNKKVIFKNTFIHQCGISSDRYKYLVSPSNIAKKTMLK